MQGEDERGLCDISDTLLISVFDVHELRVDSPGTQTTSLRGRVVYKLAVNTVVSFIQDNFTVINPS